MNAETPRRGEEGEAGRLVILRYSEGSPVGRAKNGRCFGVPQHDKVPLLTTFSSPRLGVSAFIPAF